VSDSAFEGSLMRDAAEIGLTPVDTSQRRARRTLIANHMSVALTSVRNQVS